MFSMISKLNSSFKLIVNILYFHGFQTSFMSYFTIYFKIKMTFHDKLWARQDDIFQGDSLKTTFLLLVLRTRERTHIFHNEFKLSPSEGDLAQLETRVRFLTIEIVKNSSIFWIGVQLPYLLKLTARSMEWNALAQQDGVAPTYPLQ